VLFRSVNTRIDSFTMFDYYTPAANEPITSIISLMAIADLLSEYRGDFDVKDILFVLMDNDAFDYGGSHRFVKDLQSGQLEADPKLLRTFIELSQMGFVSLKDTNNLWMHIDPIIYNGNATIKKEIDDLVQTFETKSSSKIKLVSDRTQPLPPSSYQTFLKYNLQIPGIVLADHEVAYANKYYHSIFDTSDRLNVSLAENTTEEEALKTTTALGKSLQSLTTSIASALYSLSSKKTAFSGSTNQTLINQLIYCFYVNSKCDLFRSVMTGKEFNGFVTLLSKSTPKDKLCFYTGVNNSTITGKIITNFLLRYFTRNKLADDFKQDACNADNIRAKFNDFKVIDVSFVDVGSSSNSTLYRGSRCIASAVSQHSSVSPALVDSDDGVLRETNLYPAWTESQWESKDVQMRIFVYSASSLEMITLFAGLFVLLISILITYLINKYAPKWFSDASEISHANENFLN